MPAIEKPAEQSQPERLLYSIAEAAALCNVARSYFYAAFISNNACPSIKLGRRRLVARRDLEALVEQLREQGGVA